MTIETKQTVGEPKDMFLKSWNASGMADCNSIETPMTPQTKDTTESKEIKKIIYKEAVSSLMYLC